MRPAQSISGPCVTSAAISRVLRHAGPPIVPVTQHLLPFILYCTVQYTQSTGDGAAVSLTDFLIQKNAVRYDYSTVFHAVPKQLRDTADSLKTVAVCFGRR